MGSVLRSAASLFGGVALLLTGHGLLTLLLPLRGAAEGFGPVAIGLLGSAYFAGFVAGCLHGPHLVGRAGHIRAFAAVVCGVSAVAFAYPLLVGEVAWALMRFGFGYGLAVFYLVVESWLNDRATNTTRGLLLGTYVMINHAAIAAGQMMVLAYPVAGFELFAVAGILISVAAIPVALTRAPQPAPVTDVRFRPGRLWRASPVGLIGSLMVGLANGAFWGLGAVAATGFGLDENGAALFMTAAVLAGAVTQMPVGRLSDRMDRRFVLAGLLLASICVGLALGLLAPQGIWLLVLAAVFGGVSLPCYSIAAAHAYDHADPSDYVGTASSLLLVNGLGSIAGPIGAALLMRSVPGGGLFLFIAMTQAGLLGFVLWRLRRRAAPAPESRENFDMAATSPATVGGVMTPVPGEVSEEETRA
jgi:MFS family permease